MNTLARKLHAYGTSVVRKAMGGLYEWGNVRFFATDATEEPADRGNSGGLAYGAEFDFSIHVNVSCFSETGFPAPGDSITHHATGKSYPVGAVEHTPNGHKVIIRIANVS